MLRFAQNDKGEAGALVIPCDHHRSRQSIPAPNRECDLPWRGAFTNGGNTARLLGSDQGCLYFQILRVLRVSA
jgi:hypothetical protein